MTQTQELLLFIKQAKICRSRDAVKKGFTRKKLAELLEKGKIKRIARGVYSASGAAVLPNQSYVELAIRFPHAVVCLISALQFHNLTTQLPREIWCAIEGTSRAPKISDYQLRVIRFVGAAYSQGIEEHVIAGATIKVYSVAKTVADLFRFRNKTGLDVAMEALRGAIRGKKTTLDEIRKMAKLRGVYNIMRPYIEMEISS